MRYLVIILNLLFCLPGFTQEKFNRTDIVDLALIYHGGVHRASYEWKKELFEPYVSYTNKQNQQKWLFDGFLFLEFKDGKGRNYAPGYDKLNARKPEWTWLIDRHFEKGIAFDALNGLIAEKKKVIKAPPFKHKVVMGLPSAIHKQLDWGDINGKALDFHKKEDRLAAIEWYVDEFLARFKKENYKNLQLTGFYWVDEDDRDGKGITQEVGDYVRAKGLKFYWIPYWNASGNTKWKEMGFDFAWQQPNHFFNATIPDSRLQETCDLANSAHMGLEMEFDESALAGVKDSKRNRFIAYVEAFKRNGVFDQSSIAYYQGGSAFAQLLRSKDPKDNELYHMLADLIAKRKEKKVFKKLKTK